MKSQFDQKAVHKRAVRRRESQLLAEKKVSPMDLGLKNFCMKGVNLNNFRNADGSFSLF